jgi:hypothetical protein
LNKMKIAKSLIYHTTQAWIFLTSSSVKWSYRIHFKSMDKQVKLQLMVLTISVPFPFSPTKNSSSRTTQRPRKIIIYPPTNWRG